MAWQEELVPLVRALIGDNGASTTYSDTKLEEGIVLGAHLLLKEISFDKVYTVVISTTTISPDPTESPSDVPFINLVSLRTAWLIMGGELRMAANQAISILDGPSKIDVGNVYKYKKDLHDNLEKQFKQAKFDYISGNARIGHAILTPYTNETLGYGGIIR